MFCEKCGKNLPDGIQFCDGCGAKIEAVRPEYKATAESAQAQSNSPPPAQTGYVDPEYQEGYKKCAAPSTDGLCTATGICTATSGLYTKSSTNSLSTATGLYTPASNLFGAVK